MPNYRRWRMDGGVFFFTIVMYRRRRLLTSPKSRQMLHEAFDEARSHHPFEIDGLVLIPDHIHMLMRLPDGEDDYSRRISAMKRNFTERFLSCESETAQSDGRSNQGYRGVWQERFYEHCIRDYKDFKQHLDYIHVNPVKHGLVERPADWAWSSFDRYVKQGVYEPDWCGDVDGFGINIAPEFW